MNMWIYWCFLILIASFIIEQRVTFLRPCAFECWLKWHHCLLWACSVARLWLGGKKNTIATTASWWIKVVIGKRKSLWLHTNTRTGAPSRSHTRAHLIKGKLLCNSVAAYITPLHALNHIVSHPVALQESNMDAFRLQRSFHLPPSSALISSVWSRSMLITPWLTHSLQENSVWFFRTMSSSCICVATTWPWFQRTCDFTPVETRTFRQPNI